MSPLVRVSNSVLGIVLRTSFRIGYSPTRMRRNFRLLAGVSGARVRQRYPGLRLESRTFGGVECETLTPTEGHQDTLIFLHGGGYFMGSAVEYRLFAAGLADHLGTRVILPNYRLAPEFPHPAPLDDSLAVYRALIESGAQETLNLGGDSAGGGLALSTLLAVRDQGLPMVKRAFLISPWADRTGSGLSLDRNGDKDVWLSRAHLAAWAPWSIAGQNPRDAYVSPIFGDYRGFPPLQIFVGDQEVLFDDAIGVAEKARTARAKCELVVGRDMQHDWFLNLPWLEESRSAKKKLMAFLSS